MIMIKNAVRKVFFKIFFFANAAFWKNWALFQLRHSQSDLSTINLGPDVCSNFTFLVSNKIAIGSNTVLNGNLYVNGEGGVSFGRNCHIAQGLTVYSSSHNWNSTEAIPYDNHSVLKPVSIGDAVWIGANVTIHPGCTIGDGAIISAGAVVSFDVPEGSIVAGNPGRVIAQRDMVMFRVLYEAGAFH
jgi:acetyltransferase-like isoleucine patch superfamily enzyme